MKKFWEDSRNYVSAFIFDVFNHREYEDAVKLHFLTYDGGKFTVVIGKTRAQVTTRIYPGGSRGAGQWCFKSWQQLDTVVKGIIESAQGKPLSVKADRELNAREKNVRGNDFWTRHYTFTTKGN